MAPRRRRGRRHRHRLLVEAHGGGLDHESAGAATTILTTEIADLDKQIEEIKGLENQRERLLARMRVIESSSARVPRSCICSTRSSKPFPKASHLTEVKQTGNRIELQGMAQSSTRVSTLMRNIDASDWLSRSGSRRRRDRRGRHGASVAIQAVRTAGRDYERRSTRRATPSRATRSRATRTG